MADSFDLNNQPRAADAMPAIPTSTSEVSVRTMASDLELMGQSGGMATGQAAPQAAQAAQAPQGMQVPVTLHPEADDTSAAANSADPAPRGGIGKIILITVAIVLVAAALFAVGYFFL